jgi:hypothetical protein
MVNNFKSIKIWSRYTKIVTFGKWVRSRYSYHISLYGVKFEYYLLFKSLKFLKDLHFERYEIFFKDQNPSFFLVMELSNICTTVLKWHNVS